MKQKLLAILFIVLIAYTLNAQDTKEQKNLGKIGFTFSSFGKNEVVQSNSADLVGSAHFNSDKFFTLGVNYVHPLNSWLELESGIEYSNHTILIKPNLPTDMDNTPYHAGFSLMNIPVTLRANFLKFFFVNGGLVFDIDANSSSPIDSQSGIGGLVGIAAKYDFDFRVSVFVNPYLKSHALISFSSGRYDYLMESGIRLGMTYNLNNKNEI